MEPLLLNLFVMLGLAENPDALAFKQAGWLWLVFAVLGSAIGLRLRPLLGLK